MDLNVKCNKMPYVAGHDFKRLNVACYAMSIPQRGVAMMSVLLGHCLWNRPTKTVAQLASYIVELYAAKHN